MKNKVMKKILMVMLSATMLIGSASVTAFAQANENAICLNHTIFT